MSTKFLKRKEIDSDLTVKLAKELSVNKATAELLAIRGYDTKKKAEAFLYPSPSRMSDPFDILNMDACVKRLQKAIDFNQSVVVYGDYDCDGLCALTILVKYLKRFLDNVTYYVPNRIEDGYGITEGAIKVILENGRPDLFISVDCGITSVDEVEFLKRNGVEVIITDHHEPQSVLPDCIVVDPKIEKKGFYDYCGAGLAFKIVEAHGGRRAAFDYIGYAAVATIADIVPLTDDNRLIAYFGLEKINGANCSAPFKILKTLLKLDKVNSQDIMYKIAPRINAAGRIGDANKTLELFFSDDDATTEELCIRLNEDNIKRQRMCELLIDDIKEKLKRYNVADKKIIVLYDPDWPVGILGIAASKLTENFHKPAILFTKNDDGLLRGSARSVRNVNLFDILSNFKEYFVAFGGHASAAGLSIEPGKLDGFIADLNAYVSTALPDSVFWPEYIYDVEISACDCTLELADEIKLFEPTGYQNPVPLLYLKERELPYSFIPNTLHIKAVFGECDVIMFNGHPWRKFFTAAAHTLVSLSRQEFRGKSYVQAIARQVFLDEIINISHEHRNALIIRQLSKIDCFEDKQISVCHAYDFLTDDVASGTLFISYNKETFDRFVKKCKAENKFIIRTALANTEEAPYNTVVFMPDFEYKVEYFNKLVFLDKPICHGYYSFISKQSNAVIYVDQSAQDIDIKDILDETPSEAEYAAIYRDLTNFFKNKTALEICDLYDKLVREGARYSYTKFTIAFLVFEQSGLFECEQAKSLSCTSPLESTFDLSRSTIYKFLNKRKL